MVDQTVLESLRTRLEKQIAKPSSVIVWLQGDQFDRAEKVLALYQAGLAPKILVTGNEVLVGVGPRPNETDAPVSDLVNWLTEHKVPTSDIILDKDSLNTAEQAKNTLQMAKVEKWKRILLVSSPYHQTRAFLTFVGVLQKNSFDIEIINQPALELPADQPAGGRPFTPVELWPMEIEKIVKYAADMADLLAAFNYLDQYEN